MRTRKVKSSGRFGARYGKRTRDKVVEVERKQRKKQKCPFCKRLSAKRVAAGIWHCKKCGRKFASSSYYLE